MHIVTRWFGAFLVDRGEVIEHVLFPGDIEDIASRIQCMHSGELLEEEKALVGDRTVMVTEPRQKALGTLEALRFSVEPQQYGVDSGLLHHAMIHIAREGEAAIKRDRLLMQAVGSMEEMNKTINIMSERLAEWYGNQSYDLVKSVSSKKLAELVSVYGTAEEIRQNTKLEPKTTSSFSGEDMTPIRSLARMLGELFTERERLEKYIHNVMANVAPNTSAVAGPVLGARLIARAGGLEKLAGMPASTVQVLGAENALFLHLREGTPPPKHGIIFQHTLVHDAPPWQRGKRSRTLASKISMAARIDSASGRDISEELLKNLETRIVDINRRYPNPPARKKTRGKPRGARKKGGRRR